MASAGALCSRRYMVSVAKSGSQMARQLTGRRALAAARKSFVGVSQSCHLASHRADVPIWKAMLTTEDKNENKKFRINIASKII